MIQKDKKVIIAVFGLEDMAIAAGMFDNVQGQSVGAIRLIDFWSTDEKEMNKKLETHEKVRMIFPDSVSLGQFIAQCQGLHNLMVEIERMEVIDNKGVRLMQ